LISTSRVFAVRHKINQFRGDEGELNFSIKRLGESYRSVDSTKSTFTNVGLPSFQFIQLDVCKVS